MPLKQKGTILRVVPFCFAMVHLCFFAKNCLLEKNGRDIINHHSNKEATQMKKRSLSILLVLALCIGLIAAGNICFAAADVDLSISSGVSSELALEPSLNFLSPT